MSVDKRELGKNGRGYLNRVQSASMARNGARMVLQYLCSQAMVYAEVPTVTVTKSQIIAGTGISIRSLKRALKFLRDEGCIIPTQGFAGGSGMAVTYRFCVVGQGGEDSEELVGQGDIARERWQAALTELRAINRDRAVAWYVPLQAVSISDETAHLTAPSAFIAQQVEQSYAEPIKGVLGVSRVRVTHG